MEAEKALAIVKAKEEYRQSALLERWNKEKGNAVEAAVRAKE